MRIVDFTFNLGAKQYTWKVKFWWPIWPWECKWAEGWKRGKEGLAVGWMTPHVAVTPPPLPVRLLGSLTPVSASLQTCSIPSSLSKQVDHISRHVIHIREFWGCVVWGFDAALTCELNLCLLGACSPHLRHQPPPGSHSPFTLAACPDTLVVVRCHWNDVRRRSDSQGLLLKVIAPAKEKPSAWINGHWTACEQKDKNGREKIN